MRRILAWAIAIGVGGWAFAQAPSREQQISQALLANSPRHQEWVTVKRGGRSLRCFVVYPEAKDPTPAVLIIHEVFGLSDWIRSVADRLASAGYIAIAPDLLSGEGPGGGGTSEFPNRDAVIKAVWNLPDDQVMADLNAVADYVEQLPSCNGHLAVAGFCWGGGQSFRFATERRDLKAAFVFYGPPPSPEEMSQIRCPVYGFYGGNDVRISATVPKTIRAMEAAGKTYESMIYDGAGHGFMRTGADPEGEPANRAAHDRAWRRWLKLLKNI